VRGRDAWPSVDRALWKWDAEVEGERNNSQSLPHDGFYCWCNVIHDNGCYFRCGAENAGRD